jgi:bifunctional ADP-heptose synthase (sugar kinase/adenylyltransferase)
MLMLSSKPWSHFKEGSILPLPLHDRSSRESFKPRKKTAIASSKLECQDSPDGELYIATMAKAKAAATAQTKALMLTEAAAPTGVVALSFGTSPVGRMELASPFFVLYVEVG